MTRGERRPAIPAGTPAHAGPGRVAELDLLRFAAAAAVVLYHYTYRPRIAGQVVANAFGPLPAVTRFGYLGVTLFFMISGFVILWSSQARSPGEFVVSRAARLFPSFWTCLLLTTMVVNLTGSPDPVSVRTLALNATMIPGALGAPYVDGVYWTLFVELKFYLLVYLVLMSRTMPRVEWWLAAWLGASVLAALGLASKALATVTLYPYGPYFISGCLLYLIRTRRASLPRLAALLISCVMGARYAVQQQPDFMGTVTTISGVTVAASVVGFHLAFAAVALRPGWIPESRWWYWLGGLTYPLYLLHNRIGKVLWAALAPRVSVWVALGCMLVVAVGVAAVLAAVVERRVCGMVYRGILSATVKWRMVKPVRSHA